MQRPNPYNYQFTLRYVEMTSPQEYGDDRYYTRWGHLKAEFAQKCSFWMAMGGGRLISEFFDTLKAAALHSSILYLNVFRQFLKK